MNRDLFECVCLAFAAMLVIVSLGLPRGCSSSASEADQQKNKPADELKEQRQSLQKSCQNLMLVRLLVEAELRKAMKENANRTGANQKRSAGRSGNLGRDGSAKADGLEVRQSGLGKVHR